ncbi:phage minor head protein [Oceaniglobus trochenteri]|uniref:phage minor head protein n=1 Tax=Oceaniglobus trochenteri TaxID=2763260 RepID=UPI001CFF855C|nr:phage minor head protein [Oceaniglobus trochenteri]
MPRDTRRAFAEAVKKMEPQVRRAFLQAIADVRSVSQYRLVEAAIERGDIQGIMEALRLGPEFFAPLDQSIDEAFRAGATYQLSTLPKRIPTSGGGPLIVRFQGRLPRVEAFLRRLGADLITEILDDQRTVIAEAVRYGAERGQGADTTARDLIGRPGSTGKRRGGLVGLHSDQARAVSSARDELAQGDPNYFTRKRRDRRFDGTVKRAIRDGKPLTKADIDRIAGRYSDRLLQLRGDRIARTETVKAMNAGRLEGMQQLVDSGQVPADAIVKKWDATGDARTRNSHMAMEGQTTGIDGVFLSPTGARMRHPGDTSLGAGGADTINCRCYMPIRVDWLSMAV